VGAATAGGTLSVSTSAVNLVQGAIGSLAAPLTVLNLDGGTLQLGVDGDASVARIVAVAVTIGAPTTINLVSISNVSSAVQVPLMSYGGSNPYSGLTLGTYPSGYTVTLVDNVANGSLDASIVPAVKPSPRITSIFISGATLTLQGTNGFPNGSFVLLGSTNVTQPLSLWTPLVTSSFGPDGSFNLSTNIINPAVLQQFYILSQ
jgi:hypothetical protein